MSAPTPPWTIWVIVLAIFAAAAVAFWPLIGISVLAASLAVVLFPLQRRLTRRMRPFFAAVLLTVVVGVALVLAVADHDRGHHPEHRLHRGAGRDDPDGRHRAGDEPVRRRPSDRPRAGDGRDPRGGRRRSAPRSRR